MNLNKWRYMFMNLKRWIRKISITNTLIVHIINLQISKLFQSKYQEGIPLFV